MKSITFILLLSLSSILLGQSSPDWKKFDASIFAQAQKENKLILLNLEANWCHWCHVMHDSTYSNPKVIDYLNEHFIAIKADQDGYPELSQRYREYGWPATIFLNADGQDVVKRAGYIAPNLFLKLMKAIVEDPSPEKEANNYQPRNGGFKERLHDNFIEALDYDKGGFSQAQKYVEFATFEYALTFPKDRKIQAWIKASMEGAKKLADPAWGGINQYSTHYDWEHIHFEKLLSIQARYIQLFVYHYALNGDDASLDYAKNIAQYSDRFLHQKNGLYANAQDADLVKGVHAEAYFALSDPERLQQGIPAIDEHTYTNNNAAFATSLLQLYYATSDITYLQSAQQIKKQLIQRENNGLYDHSTEKRDIQSLKDQVAMASLFISFLKYDPNNSNDLQRLTKLMDRLSQTFILDDGSVMSFSGSNGLPPQPIIEENIKMARLFNWFGHFTHSPKYHDLATDIYRFLTQRDQVENYYHQPELLLLADEIKTEPYHFSYLEIAPLDPKEDPFRTCLAAAPFYSTFDKFSKDELPDNQKDFFESSEENALLICTSTFCSSPIYSKEDAIRFLKNR